METKVRYILPVFFAVLVSSCTKELDTSGFFYSADRVNERFNQSEAWNTIHAPVTIPVSTDSYILYIAGDSHIGGTDNFDSLVRASVADKAAAFVMIGDIVTGQKYDYDSLRNHLPTDSTRYFMVAGNHDLFFDGWKTFYEYFGSSTYYFTVTTPADSDLFICLESGSGTLGADQLDWLKNILTTIRSQYRRCIVFSHVNLFREHRTSSTNVMTDEIRILLDLFAKNNVDMTFSGHDHRRSTEVFGNTTYVTLDALKDGFSEASYLQLKITNGTPEIQFVGL